MALTSYEWIYGISQVAVLLLSVVAGIISLSLLSSAKKHLYAWRYLLVALTLFALVSFSEYFEHSAFMTLDPGLTSLQESS